jgi:hypothetical protein
MKKVAVAIAIVLATAGCGGSDSGSSKPRTNDGAPSSASIPGFAAQRAVVWAVGDAATAGPAADRIAALIRRAKPQLFLYLGDVYETGTPAEFRQQYDPRYGRLAGITMATQGNHEYANRYRGFYPYWAGKHNRQPSLQQRQIAGWQILELNSQAPHGPDSRQVHWLEQTLENAQGDCRIAFWHRPRLTHGGYDSAPDLNPLWHRLAGHARIVLSGHDHTLQRHRPVRGLIQYVVGAGGRARYHLRSGDPTRVWGRDDVDGALRMVLKPGRALLEFRSPRGRLLDRSRVTCSPAGQ